MFSDHRRHLPRPRGFRLSHHHRRTAVRDQHLPAGRPGRARRPTIEMKGWNLEEAELTPPADGRRAGRPSARRAARTASSPTACRSPWTRCRSASTRSPTTTRRTPRRSTLPDHRQRAHRSRRTTGTCSSSPAVPARRSSRRSRPAGSIRRWIPCSSSPTRPARCWRSTTITKTSAPGVNTHHADSYLMVKLPADGTYYVHLGDTARNGGEEYAYRLRISAPQPDFALRVVPSSVAPAQQGHRDASASMPSARTGSPARSS